MTLSSGGGGGVRSSHPVSVSAFIIYRGLCAYTVCSAVLFILSSRLLVYSSGSGVTRVQVVLSGFSVRLVWFVYAKTLCSYIWLYVFLCCIRACVRICDGDVIFVGSDLNWCSGWW